MRACASLMVVLAITASVSASGDDDYLRIVKPILEQRCYACHGVLKQEAELRLDSGKRMLAGGETGPVVVPHKPAGSLLLERITSADKDSRMPPEGNPLSEQEIAAITQWIAAGARTPADEKEQVDPRLHWAFVAPKRPMIPVAENVAWNANPIDAFIASRHLQLNIQPLSQTSPVLLLRRVYLDLIGIPPTRAELADFLSNESATAYEAVVDELLSRPEYGERWGRHWMDVWRYSDWYGRRAVPDVMNSYPHIWRWRDWIVQSLNQDKGYDCMIQEMLAADELAPGDDSSVVATGFIVRNWFKWNYENWMKDNVEHTAKAFLGLTLQCAHCHDHKYDPLTQEEYFRFRAFFEPLELRQDRVAGMPDPGPFVKYVYAKAYGPTTAGMVRVFDEKLDASTFMYEKGDARNRLPGRDPVNAGVPAILSARDFVIRPIELPPEAFYPGLKTFIRDEERTKLNQQIELAEQAFEAATKKLKDCQSKLEVFLNRASITSAASQSNSTTQTSSATQANSSAEASSATQVSSASQLNSTERDLLIARSQQRQEIQNVESLKAARSSLQARIAADDARYRGHGDVGVLSKIASRAERQAKYEAAQLRLAQADHQLLSAQLKQTEDAKTKAAVDKAIKELADARGALDSARGELLKEIDQYSPLSPIYPRTSTGRRLALANWIANRENPLTARVAVNHLWLRHFGRGLVDTPSNFGRNGHAPSHPELLDFLAVELMENGWKMKHIHRLIVTSQTYRLRSNLGASTHINQSIDPDNTTYWRASTQRMESEVVRDSLLACAGELNKTIGGPEIDAGQGLISNRRSMYFAIHGEGKMQFLELFDAPDVCDCYQRTTSVRPQQSLALTNSELPLRLSQTLAGKLWSEVSATAVLETNSSDRPQVVNFISAAFETILSRPPSPQEIDASAEFLREQALIIAANEPPGSVQPALVGSTSAKTSSTATAVVTHLSPDERARQALVRTLFNHNDFVTIR